MILSYQTIKQYCEEYKMIYPWFERTIFEGMSYGLGPASYDFRCAQYLDIFPGDFVLCSTIEEVRMPIDVAASVVDKSSWARRGLVVQNTMFDPGFIGYPTIELTNHSKNTIKINRGMPICQFIFFKLDKPTLQTYKGKYMYQPNRPVGAIDERD